MGKPYTRLFSITSLLSSRYPVLLFDDCEGLLKWIVTGTGTPSVTINDTLCFNGSKSIKLKTNSVIPAPLDEASASRSFALSPAKVIEISCYFYVPIMASISRIIFGTEAYDGSFRHISAIHYYAAQHKWQYENQLGNKIDITGADITLAEATWHRFTMSLNLITNTYRKFSIDQFVYDLSQYSLISSASSTNLQAKIDISIIADDDSEPELMFDDFLCSELEL